MVIQATITVSCVGRMAESLHQDLAPLKRKYRKTFFDDLGEPVMHRGGVGPFARLMGMGARVDSSSITFKVYNFDRRAIDEFASILASDGVTGITAEVTWGDRAETVSIDPRKDIIEELLKDLSDNPGRRARR